MRRIIDDMEENGHTAHAWYYLGGAYRYIGDYGKAVQYYETVLERWPGYVYAWSAQYLIGAHTERMMKKGEISVAEGEAKIEAAWQTMVDDYQGRPLYGHALCDLGRFYLERGQGEKAIGYFATFCEEYPEDRRRAKVMYDLGGAYESIGETALAVDVYEDFVQDYPDDELAAEVESRLAELRGAN